MPKTNNKNTNNTNDILQYTKSTIHTHNIYTYIYILTHTIKVLINTIKILIFDSIISN